MKKNSMDRHQFLVSLVALGASATVPVLASTNKAVTGQSSMRIGLIGVGGAGGNTMAAIAREIPQLARTIAIQTCSHSFSYLKADQNILIGDESVIALDPLQTRKMAMARVPEIEEAISGFDLVFISTGMGGATGTGIAPLVAEITRRMDIPTFGVAISPFEWEGVQRNQRAQLGLHYLQRCGAKVFSISNERMVQSLGDESDEITQDVFFDGISLTARDLCIRVSNAVSQDRLTSIDFEDIRWRRPERS
jgi:cell division protein FtsZ